MTYSDDVKRTKCSIDYQEYLEYRVNALENRVEFLEAQLDVMKLVIIDKQ